MYFRYMGTKYWVDKPANEYKKDPLPILLDTEELIFITITNWLGTQPQKSQKEENFTAGPFLRAVHCKYCMEGIEISAPITWNALLQRLYKEKQVLFTVYTSFKRDLLAHTDGGFKQELVTKILVEERHWGKIDVVSYKVVGIEVPDQLIVSFKVEGRKKF